MEADEWETSEQISYYNLLCLQFRWFAEKGSFLHWEVKEATLLWSTRPGGTRV